MKITLGFTYRDKITGFVGVATGHVIYITGCNQTLLTPMVKPDGSLSEPVWLDDQRLASVPDVESIHLDNGTNPGPDAPAPKR